jgi:hypothetical protein
LRNSGINNLHANLQEPEGPTECEAKREEAEVKGLVLLNLFRTVKKPGPDCNGLP